MNETPDPNITSPQPPAGEPETKPTDPAGDDTVSSSQTVITTLHTRSEGIKAGLLNISEEAYVRFLEALEERNEAQIRFRKAEQEASALRNREAELRALQRDEAEREAEKSKQVEHLREAIALKNQDKSRLESEIANWKTAIAGIDPGYGWISIALFLLAGIVFIAADVAITHDIVSTGLRMANPDAWVFAFGLALVAFLLKPAYDRIFEKSYPGQTRKRTHWFLGAMSVLAIGMLVVLGVFRHEAGKSLDRLKQIDEEMSALREKMNVEAEVDEEQILSRIEELKVNQGNINEARVGHWSRMVGMVMAGVMMAIGGAICLGIAFPAMERRWEKGVVLPNKLRSADKLLEKVRDGLEQQTTGQNQAEVELAKSQARRASLQNPDALAARAEAAEAAWSQALADLHDAEKRAQTAFYTDAHARGLALSERYQVVLTWNEDGSLSFDRQPRRTNSSSKPKTPRVYQPRGQYLHQRLRNYISEQIND